MTLTLTLIFFILGLIIGSFLNVVIYRYNTRKSFGGRSACMSCRSKLSWYELIPLVSFVALQGRCKSCKTKISIQYPLVELAAGLIFASLFLKFQDVFFISSFVFAVTYAYYAIMFSILLVIAVYDLKHKIIPDMLALIFGILAFIGLFFFSSSASLSFLASLTSPVFSLHLPSNLEFLSGILISSPFAFFWLVSGGAWMGLGDAKLALGLGWLLGISSGLSAIVVAFWTGAIISLYLIIFNKSYNMKSEIPFAPYLVFGALTAFLFGLALFGTF